VKVPFVTLSVVVSLYCIDLASGCIPRYLYAPAWHA